MSNKLYEVVSEGRFEINFEVRTMEEATGVLYTNKELRELYNDGEEWVGTVNEKTVSCPKYINYRYDPRSLIFLDDILSHVLNEFKDPKKKEVLVELSDHAIFQLCYFCQTWLKQNGVMCRPSTGAFIRFKVRPKKVGVKKSFLMRIKRQCVFHLQLALSKEHGLDMKWLGTSKEEVLMNYVKFGMKLGYTVESILCGLPFHYSYKRDEAGNGVFEYYPLNWYLTNILLQDVDNQQELIDLYLIKFRNWLEEISPVELSQN